MITYSHIYMKKSKRSDREGRKGIQEWVPNKAADGEPGPNDESEG